MAMCTSTHPDTKRTSTTSLLPLKGYVPAPGPRGTGALQVAFLQHYMGKENYKLYTFHMKLDLPIQEPILIKLYFLDLLYQEILGFYLTKLLLLIILFQEVYNINTLKSTDSVDISLTIIFTFNLSKKIRN